MAERQEAQSVSAKARRDDRVDLLRGLALICIFFDHIPDNALSALTVGRLGFSDAAEIFVLLAGYAACAAYGSVLDRSGVVVMLRKVVARGVTIYAAHAALVLVSISIVLTRAVLTGLQPTLLAPIIDDGVAGILRALSLQALPAYLDILPLYLVLLGAFPLILLGLRTNMPATLAASAVLYLLANLLHVNVPNHIDRMSAATWTFNPFAWQTVYVLGAAFAEMRRLSSRLLAAPPRWLTIACWCYLVFAWLIVGCGELLPGLRDAVPAALFGNEPRCFLTPWRFLNVAALGYLALTSDWLREMARKPLLAPALACGRQSLVVFSVGCVLTLLGRLVFADLGSGMVVQTLVNAVGLALMMSVGIWLDSRKAARKIAPSSTVAPSTALVGPGL